LFATSVHKTAADFDVKRARNATNSPLGKIPENLVAQKRGSPFGLPLEA
jgi:hypothetical protein